VEANKRRSTRPKPAKSRNAWLTSDSGKVRPKGAQFTVTALDTLWRLLELGDCTGVLVDRRFSFPAGDAWEAALTIRERYPLLPLSVLASVDFAPLKRGRKTAYVSQKL